MIARPQSLSIIIPVYNEPRWLGVAVADAITALNASLFTESEIVIVDDGSDEVTRRSIEDLRSSERLKVIHHPENRGRLAARRTGLAAARGDFVLFVDSRVSIHERSLAFVSEQVRDPELQVWNASVDIDDVANPYARYWQIVAELAWPDYFAAHERVQYGPEDYDKYPKGTGCFLAPRVDLIDAMNATTSLYSDSRRGSDELFLRRLVERHRFNIAPEFSCTYRARPSLRGFVRHAHHRGVFFVDGFLRPGTRFFGTLLAFFPASALVVAAVLWHPRRAARLLVLMPLLGATGAIATRRPLRDVRVMALLGFPWLLAFSAGIWRGFFVMLRDRVLR